MKRRNLLLSIGGAAVAWPSGAGSQQPAMPLVGFLRSTPAAPFVHIVVAFRNGLKEAGYVEGENVGVEFRWADNKLDLLPALALDLIERGVAVIVGNSLAVEAAKAATSTIPIVFVTADDPVKSGFVANLNQPDGNITGVTFFAGGQLGAKRLELLHELVPKVKVIAVLFDPNYPGFEGELPSVEQAGRILGLQIVLVKAAGESDFAAVFSEIIQAGAGALLIGGSPVFTGKRRELVAQATRYAIPAIYDQRDHVVAGGLISYAASFTAAYRQAGVYAGKIVGGAKPADLPVLQPTTFELIVNLKTAKALGLAVPESIMLRADEVIE